MTGRVLVARLDSVGDVLLAGPAVRAIAAGRGGAPAEVVMLCGPQGAPAARLLPGVVDVLTWAAPWIVDPAPPVTSGLLREVIDTAEACGAAEAVILTSFHQSPLPLALALRLAGIARITGASVDYAGSLLDVRLKPGEDFPEDQPEAERALRIAAAAGYQLPPDDDGRLHVTGLPDVSALVGEAPYVVVHPGAAVPARAWPPLHHAAAVELLTAAGFRVVVTGGPAETGLTATVAGPEGLDLGGRTDLASLAAVLQGAAAVITGNTGPAHLAAAVGTPVACLFSPVVPAVRWAPYKVPVELLGDQGAPCALSRARTCPVPGHPCLSSVQPEEVVDAVRRLTAGVASLGSRRRIGRAETRGRERRSQ
ncbi:MAG: D-glycero-beta-D-manno-heptose-1,7-bisphosphate 7-phosphatase; possible Histidinol-phosphatase [uncultured Arthrobacter sp.]|uniref:D-glycero-beta-D-manno-heptose-1,7-bisphosphate 7-phosphatase possible Histidinol-phosphatase n=1 Tax=uncultured Arthrobacter sp. TaxID=114050 RepID=A0A6J4J924_9MICC|nr:glycosyltransferase family 9 protein [uncultured Arthrobacter sp.]CAA9270021.1 MAG: D-glycero-beta-D-manno-heptose-1,7-bisphosphate 7-phosphatase; possible Histidinol-phosphatase [uncultured Arthrobacter sp.]